ncbi:MAG TPA: ABC-2 transporter permease [Candidatus Choladousia intestinavium]|uniref:ABC-2 transporter permease n=1 Tax=Candidatus Choladousia intestinavium TaxID=2840727 RepID=A0A9D1ADN2_9FIRM|nr:ABC-2 transporter permease [Candidatus Choladousia intestinavium]
MKGLLIKDIKLMLKQKNFFLMLIVIAVLMAYAVENASYIIGYLSVVGSLFTLSSISYDEFDNGNAFLFSLPITRKAYVVEKYGFGLILGGGFWLLASVLTILAEFWKRQAVSAETLSASVGTLFAVFLILAVLIPIQLKFGGERGRIALLIVVGISVVLGVAGAEISRMLSFSLSSLVDRALSLNAGIFTGSIAAVSLLLLLLSCRLSIGIVRKKEF